MDFKQRVCCFAAVLEPPAIIAFDEIDSTNAEARRRAEAGETGPVWITAERQSAGRGRRGREWESPRGNLSATLLFDTTKSLAEAAAVSFVAALAVSDLAAAFVAPGLVSLKWPNDPLIAGRKTAGILIESGALSSGGLWVAAGIGVNLAHPPVASAYPAACFAEHMTAPPPKPMEALLILAEAFERWRTLWNRSGFAVIAEAWTARAHGLGQTCTARLSKETLQGVAEGLDTDGALRLRLASGEVRRITAGDVYF